MLRIIMKILFVTILYIAFTIQGLFEETVYGKKYTNPDNENETFRFSEPNLNFFSIAIISVIISGTIIYMNKFKKSLFSFHDNVIMGVLYTLGKMSTENSLKYLDFISKTIAKSVKSLSSKIFLIKKLKYIFTLFN